MKFAQCMRQNGIDIPDPQPGQAFGNLQGVGREKMEKARELCGQHLQGLRKRLGQ